MAYACFLPNPILQNLPASQNDLNRVVDSFLAEAALEKPQSIDKLNQLFWVWLEECYQKKPHSALVNNMSPETAFRSDKKPLRFLEPELIATPFYIAKSAR